MDIPVPGFRIGPCEEMLFVGSCFATEIGRRFQEEQFRAMVNPYGVMYNPASILHTIARLYSSVPSAVPSNLQLDYCYHNDLHPVQANLQFDCFDYQDL